MDPGKLLMATGLVNKSMLNVCFRMLGWDMGAEVCRALLRRVSDCWVWRCHGPAICSRSVC